MLDLVLKGGTVVDPSQNITEEILDVAIQDGKIDHLARNIVKSSGQTLDVSGYLVVPGLIDAHTHVFWGGTSLGLDPNRIDVDPGVTTLVDAGSAGAGNFPGFARFIVDRCWRRVLAFINLSFPGIFGFYGDYRLGELTSKQFLNVSRLHAVLREHASKIKGIKIRLDYIASGDQGYSPLLWALDEGKLNSQRLMVHFGKPPPTLDSLLPLLRSGDILTHIYRGMPNSIVDNDGRVVDKVIKARQRGVKFDTGHGVGSFSFATAQAAFEQGFYPDILSSDLHVDSIRKLKAGLVDVMSRALALGMPLDRIIAATTILPARLLGIANQLGSFKPGHIADITVLTRCRGKYTFQDYQGNVLNSSVRLRPLLSIVSGCVVNLTKKETEVIDENHEG